MRFGIDTPQFGLYANPITLATLAREAEDSGWDGFFIWDHIQVNWPDPVADPWIALAAIAVATERIRIGALVTPIARRHPWKLARETVTLDHLSNGRLVMGAGLGLDVFGELSAFGVSTDDRVRAEMLDEGLQILNGLWSGEKFSFAGQYYQVKETQFLPPPIQQPRIPIWLAGTWPRKRPFRRAARYDGVIPIGSDIEKALTPEDIGAIAAFVRANRTGQAPFDIVHSGVTSGISGSADADVLAPYASAGATWWLEAVWPWKQSFEEFRSRIRKGPPRL